MRPLVYLFPVAKVGALGEEEDMRGREGKEE